MKLKMKLLAGLAHTAFALEQVTNGRISSSSPAIMPPSTWYGTSLVVQVALL